MENSSEITHLKRRTAAACNQRENTTDHSSADNKPEPIAHTDNRRITFRCIQILLIVILSLLVILAIAVTYEQLVSFKLSPHRPASTKFKNCVSELGLKFPNQDPLLWRQIVKNYNFNQERRRTVMCQTFITHRANRHPLDCLIRKLSKCLDGREPYKFIPVSDPIHSASLLERDLNSTDRKVGYFREITDLTHPIPTVFHAICDPDHSPYKERVFFFTISTDSLTKKSGEYTPRDISNSISEVLNKYWKTRDGLFPPEQISFVISRIANTAYYFHEEGNIKC